MPGQPGNILLKAGRGQREGSQGYLSGKEDKQEDAGGVESPSILQVTGRNGGEASDHAAAGARDAKQILKETDVGQLRDGSEQVVTEHEHYDKKKGRQQNIGVQLTLIVR
jgi:hypothetical protein